MLPHCEQRKIEKAQFSSGGQELTGDFRKEPRASKLTTCCLVHRPWFHIHYFQREALFM